MKLIGKLDTLPQLCRLCAKAGGGCAWSDRFEPVDGWTARPTKLRLEGKHGSDSYEIVQCPEFKPEAEHTYTRPLNDEGVTALCCALLNRAGKDYRDAAPGFGRKSIEDFFLKGNIFTELLCLDGKTMLRKMQRALNIKETETKI